MWSGALRAALIWTKASRWRKVSKCKSLVKQVQMHLTIQKNRRDAIIRQARVDIAQLLQNGQPQQALARVETLQKDQCLLAAYDQIDHFCSCISISIVHVFKNKTVQDLPSSVGEAMASLIFAASRCGELPELRLLRGLFTEQYGWEFDITSVELRPGNLVNSQLKEKLCINLIPDDVKQGLLSDLVNKSSVQMTLQDRPGTARQKYSFSDKDFKDKQKFDGIQIQIPKLETARKTGIVCSLSNGDSTKTKKNEDQDHRSNGNIHINIDSGGRNASFRTYAMTSLPRKSPTGKMVPSKIRYDHLSPMDAPNKDRSKMLAKGRHSFSSSADEHKIAKGISPCHVHPKLPEYDDLVAKLRSLKAEYRHHKSFSFF
ncbi:hypothetical protein PRUPE_4G186000 [Prunus persica]|uniref:IST1-like protein n=1 Tax=Prunus persica TaxID=3760 RepID=A0A251PMP4_PRUPE|nr:hypothetical protein PRUPE_4G186000 [Prunus persica]